MNAVTIVGGGMAGATLALALSRLGEGRIAVTLIEAQRPDELAHPGFDARAIALAQGTCQQLERIGCWSLLAREATPIKTVLVSDRGHGGMATLNAGDYGLSALGQVVELHEAGRRLFSLLEHAPNVTLRCPAKVVASERDGNSVTVELNDGERIASSLLVAADGSFSAVAASLGVEWDEENYGQTALIANVTTAEPHQGRAFERFTAQGPLALLPMSKGRMSLVWCIDESRRQEAMAWSERRFIGELQSAFGWRLGEILSVGERHGYPLRLRTARQEVSHRLALVGNAAQTLHPIAGQGFNLGLRDVISLAETLVEASKQGEDVGGYRTLRRYRLRRESDRKATIGLTDGLVHLFANRHAPLAVARNLGLIAMDSCKLLRLPLAYRTLGWVKR
ncbi:2-octaprenyl-6-methoxyphenyl hydroxylase [Leminorella grimontii]|uniref:2-octaprenyl-6-methoxyphenyl hydroxylase n=1 Tax=Leminorella grimontii TaxID=82981 RepID=UPI002084EE52|nr:2-octaprenyl-6-methoxyphenyl hydroxylase [Leminorella grimontii]GKX60995.1 2-octaprenyl-6-methoxyphenyl hydroxylase [Leminorella grimontii]